MGAKVLKQEGYKVSMEISISPEDFKDGISRAYQKTKGRYNVQGFRKGKAPQYMIERVYGEGVFYDEAINILFPEQYEKAIDETGIYPVDHPSVDLKEIDPKKGVVMAVEVDVKPEVKLGKYKGVEIENIAVKVTSKDVEEALEAEAKKNSRTITVEGRPVKDGDLAIIDFEGFLDGEAFEGGKGENHELKIGSGQFIPGFEEQIIGRNIGEEFDVNVTFPEDYQAEELKGRDTVFKVKLHEIKETEIPVIDDEFAMDVSEFDTLEEYKEDIKKNIKEKRQKDAEETMKDEALGKAVENAEVEIPPAMVERRIDGQIRDFEMRIKYQGMDLDQYLGLIGMDRQQMREQFRESSLKQVKVQLVTEAVSLAEKVEAADEEFEAKIEEVARNYGMSVEDYKKNLNDEYIEYMKDGIVYEKTVDLIFEKSVKSKKTAKSKESKKDDAEKE
ncbi:MAG: trigger factor [Clostridia bacterium]|nr:trigger factor [Clostridia bacterium]MBN2881977.1 trigger factor [Clostridia bacterium]